MKIEVNGKEILTLTELQKKVLQYDISPQILEAELIKDLKWILEHKLERCSERLKSEWTPKLVASGITAIPLKKEKFAEEVFKHIEYKDRSAREVILEAKRAEELRAASERVQ